MHSCCRCVFKVLFVIPDGTSGLVASSPTQHNNKQLKTHKNTNNIILFVVESPLWLSWYKNTHAHIYIFQSVARKKAILITVKHDYTVSSQHASFYLYLILCVSSSSTRCVRTCRRAWWSWYRSWRTKASSRSYWSLTMTSTTPSSATRGVLQPLFKDLRNFSVVPAHFYTTDGRKLVLGS